MVVPSSTLFRSAIVDMWVLTFHILLQVDFRHDSLLLTHDQAAKCVKQLWESYIKRIVGEFFAELDRVSIGFSLYPKDEDLSPAIREQFCQYMWDKCRREPSIKPGTTRIKKVGKAYVSQATSGSPR